MCKTCSRLMYDRVLSTHLNHPEEASTNGIKTMLLKILQYSQENICVGASFQQSCKPRQVFSWKYCQIFKNIYKESVRIFFEEHLRRLLMLVVKSWNNCKVLLFLQRFNWHKLKLFYTQRDVCRTMANINDGVSLWK